MLLVKLLLLHHLLLLVPLVLLPLPLLPLLLLQRALLLLMLPLLLLPEVKSSSQPTWYFEISLNLSTRSLFPLAPVNLFEAARVAAAGGGAAAAATAPGSAADLMQLAQLTASPQFQQLRQVIQTQPQLLPVLLQQIGQSNPHIFQVSEKREIFLLWI